MADTPHRLPHAALDLRTRLPEVVLACLLPLGPAHVYLLQAPAAARP